MQKKQTILVVASLLVVVLSVTLAYFTAQIIGKGKDVSVTSNNLQILFDHSDGNITGTDITPGWSTTKKFTITNKSNATYKYDIVIQNLVNTFVTEGYLQYKITSDNGGYSTTDYVDVPKSSTATDTVLGSANIEVGVTQTYTIEFIYKNAEDVDQSDDMGKKLSGTLFITEDSKPTLAEKLLEDNPTISERTDFSTPFTNNTTGTLFTATEKNVHNTTDTTVYYYAGNTTNNWVKFGKQKQAICTYNGQQVNKANYMEVYEKINFVLPVLSESDCTSDVCVTNEFGPVIGVTQSQCNSHGGTWAPEASNYEGEGYLDLFWRIIRTNADGGVRMLYSGIAHDTTVGYIGSSTAFNSIGDDPMYVGYKYGTSGSLESNRTNNNDSTIKKLIDAWYEDGLKANDYTKYLSATAVYCNDRNLNSEDTYTTSTSGYFDFTPKYRAYSNYVPTYDCTEVNDAFSVENTSAKLDYPVALMTADEIMYAGGKARTSLTEPYVWYTLNSANTGITMKSWWLMSPGGWDHGAYMFLVVNSIQGQLNSSDVVDMASNNVVRPVVSLKSCVKYSSGDGTASNPYTIEETESEC